MLLRRRLNDFDVYTITCYLKRAVANLTRQVNQLDESRQKKHLLIQLRYLQWSLAGLCRQPGGDDDGDEGTSL